MEIIPRNGIFVAIFLCIGVANTVAYSKFGRKCSDIGCPSNQVCVLVDEPCTRGNNGNCGSYPTCTNKPAGGGAPRRPGVGGRGNGDRGRPYAAPQPIPPTPPPRTSSRVYGNRYPYNVPKPIVPTSPPRPFYSGNGGYGRSSNSIGSPDSVRNRDYDSTNRGAGSGRRGQRPTHEESKDVLYPQNSASVPEPGHSNNSPVPSAPVSLPNQPSKPSGYPTGSGYPSNPSGDASYPPKPSGGASYPSYPSSAPSYPSSGSSYPSYPSSGSSYPADPSRKQNMGAVNAGYASTGQSPQYPAAGSYYPQGGYPQGNYPQSGYPQNPYQGQYPQNPYQGQYPQNPYPGQYPQNPYQGQYPQQPQKPKKPSFTDQLTNFAKNIATRVLTQAVVDKVSG